MKTILKIKPISITILFISFVIVPIAIGIIFSLNLMMVSKLTVVLECYLFTFYLFSLEFNLRRHPSSTSFVISRIHNVLFNVSIVYTVIYIPVFCFTRTEGLILLPLHFIGMALMGFSITYVFRLFTSVENSVLLTYRDIFLKIKKVFSKNRHLYLWDIQRRVNKLFESNS